MSVINAALGNGYFLKSKYNMYTGMVSYSFSQAFDVVTHHFHRYHASLNAVLGHVYSLRSKYNMCTGMVS